MILRSPRFGLRFKVFATGSVLAIAAAALAFVFYDFDHLWKSTLPAGIYGEAIVPDRVHSVTSVSEDEAFAIGTVGQTDDRDIRFGFHYGEGAKTDLYPRDFPGGETEDGNGADVGIAVTSLQFDGHDFGVACSTVTVDTTGRTKVATMLSVDGNVVNITTANLDQLVTYGPGSTTSYEAVDICSGLYGEGQSEAWVWVLAHANVAGEGLRLIGYEIEYDSVAGGYELVERWDVEGVTPPTDTEYVKGHRVLYQPAGSGGAVYVVGEVLRRDSDRDDLDFYVGKFNAPSGTLQVHIHYDFSGIYYSDDVALNALILPANSNPIVVCGYTASQSGGANENFAIMQFSASGLSTTSQGSHQIYDAGGTTDRAYDIAYLGTDAENSNRPQVVIGGSGDLSGDVDMFIVRYPVGPLAAKVWDIGYRPSSPTPDDYLLGLATDLSDAPDHKYVLVTGTRLEGDGDRLAITVLYEDRNLSTPLYHDLWFDAGTNNVDAVGSGSFFNVSEDKLYICGGRWETSGNEGACVWNGEIDDGL